MYLTTIELHLSGLFETKKHSDMQKIRIIGFKKKKKKGYIGSLKWKKITQAAILGYIFIYVQIKL
jgi:hypothetical protein